MYILCVLSLGFCSLFFFFLKVMERRERRDSGFSSSPLPPPPRVSSAGSVSGARPGEVRTNRMEKQRDTSITSTKVEGGERERRREWREGGREGVSRMVTTATTLCFGLSF